MQAANTVIDTAARLAVTAGADADALLAWLSPRIETWSHLLPAHRLRLRARFRAQCGQPASLAALKPRLAALPSQGRPPVARLLVQLVASGGMPAPATVKALERIYQALGLEGAALYGDLHAADPAGVAGAEDRPATAAWTLDPERIARLQRETEQVSALLAEVFVEDAPAAPTTLPMPANPPQPPATGIWGLDARHDALLRLLLGRPAWSRAEVEALAAPLGLMTDGALERLNDAAYDHLDQPLTEGDDPIELNPDILENPPA